MTAAETPDGGTDATLVQLGELADQVRLLAEGLELLGERYAEIRQELDGPAGRGYRPVPAPKWWMLSGEERDLAVARLRDWVETVYRPGYGEVANALPACWARHDFALYALDWLSELHSVLYLQPHRTQAMLTTQAEWQGRILPAIADAIAAEARSCGHSGRPR